MLVSGLSLFCGGDFWKLWVQSVPESSIKMVKSANGGKNGLGKIMLGCWCMIWELRPSEKQAHLGSNIGLEGRVVINKWCQTHDPPRYVWSTDKQPTKKRGRMIESLLGPLWMSIGSTTTLAHDVMLCDQGNQARRNENYDQEYFIPTVLPTNGSTGTLGKGQNMMWCCHPGGFVERWSSARGGFLSNFSGGIDSEKLHRRGNFQASPVA